MINQIRDKLTSKRGSGFEVRDQINVAVFSANGTIGFLLLKKLLFFTYKLIRLRRLCTLFKATYTWSEYGKNEYINEFVIEA